MSSVAKLMKGTLVIFNPPGKTLNVLQVSKKTYMIKVPVAFRSVTETRINTCNYIGVVIFHGHLVEYIYEQ